MNYDQFIKWLQNERRKIGFDQLTNDWADYSTMLHARKLKTEALANWEKTQEKYFGKINDLKKQIPQLQQRLKEAQDAAANTRQELAETSKIRVLKRKELTEQVNLQEATCQRLEQEIQERRESIERVHGVLFNLADGGLNRIESDLSDLEEAIPIRKRQLEEREQRATELYVLAVDRYGLERQEFLDWFAQNSHLLSDIPAGLVQDLEMLKQHRAAIMQAVEQNVRQAVQQHLEDARQIAEAAPGKADEAMNYRTNYWAKTMDHQRNLSGDELGITDKDISTHDELTKQMYAELKKISVWPNEAAQAAQKIASEFSQIQVLANAQQLDGPTFKQLLTLSVQRLQGLVESAENYRGQGWAHIVHTGTKAMKSMKTSLTENRDTFLSAATKMVEQATNLIPSALEGFQQRCAEISKAAEEEMTKVPRRLQAEVREELVVLNNFRKQAKELESTYLLEHNAAMNVLEELRQLVG